MKNILEDSYRGKIKEIYKKLTPADKKDLEGWIRNRRTKAGEEKCSHYKTNLLTLRYVAEVPFSRFNENAIIENLLIRIRDSRRELVGKNELRKTLKNFIKWKFVNMSIRKFNALIDLIQLEKQPFYNKKKYNKQTMPTDEEVEKMFLGMNNLKHKAMFTMQEEMALAPAVELSLKWSQLKDCGDHYEVFAERKKNNEDTLLVFKTGYVHLKRWENEFQYPYRRQDDYVFPNDFDRALPLNSHYLSDLYRRVCKKQKIKNITPYMIRRRRLMFVQKKTGNLELSSKMGMHSILVAQRVYHNFDEYDVKDMIMEEVYGTKEPTVEEKNEFLKEIDNVKKQGKKDMDIVNGKLNKFVEFLPLFEAIEADKELLQMLKLRMKNKLPA
jgi:integrase